MKVTLNGRELEVTNETIVAQLLKELDVPCAGTAVAINGAIVPRDHHDSRKIAEGDRIDILRAIGGG